MSGDEMRREIIRLRALEGADVVGTCRAGRDGWVATVYAGSRMLGQYDGGTERAAIEAALVDARGRPGR
jgi:hypothetical protein